MLSMFVTIFRIPELRRKIFITLLFLVVYRIGYYVPLPMVDQVRMAEQIQNASQGTFGQILGYFSLFSGGDLSQACIFALGIMPYISASIILQLLSTGVIPSLEKLRKEGSAGQKKINEYTRYLTVPICILQGLLFVRFLFGSKAENNLDLLLPGYDPFFFGLAAIIIMTTGCLFLMWIGEQIDEYGIGNGISLIIMAGIVGRLPQATSMLLFVPGTTTLNPSLLTLGGGEGGDISLEYFIILLMLFVAVVMAVVLITKAKRQIPVQSARHVRGRGQTAGAKSFLPMKINAAGVMPVIFASTMLLLPGVLFSSIYTVAPEATWANWLGEAFQRGSGWFYNIVYVGLIFLFCYFWVAVQFNPKEIADNLKDQNSFIPGYRPGKSTADYLEKVLMRITYVGAAFLGVLAIIPTIVSTELGVPFQVAAFYGGTGLLIVVSVALDLVQKINAHLVMRDYASLTGE